MYGMAALCIIALIVNGIIGTVAYFNAKKYTDICIRLNSAEEAEFLVRTALKRHRGNIIICCDGNGELRQICELLQKENTRIILRQYHTI